MATVTYGKIVDSGMGGFLNPPTHPEHRLSVHSSHGDKFSMSLTAARDSAWLNPQTRKAAANILRHWQPLPITSAEVEDWIARVLGYFRGCYSPDGEKWNAQDLIIDKRNPLQHADRHAGVHLIRRYYPNYQPTVGDFANAYWGKC